MDNVKRQLKKISTHTILTSPQVSAHNSHERAEILVTSPSCFTVSVRVVRPILLRRVGEGDSFSVYDFSVGGSSAVPSTDYIL